MRKMRKILLWQHNPDGQSFIHNSAYGQAIQTLSENEDKLTELLEGKERKLLFDLVNAQSLVDGTTAMEHFVCGFRLVARMAIEIMNDEDGNFALFGRVSQLRRMP